MKTNLITLFNLINQNYMFLIENYTFKIKIPMLIQLISQIVAKLQCELGKPAIKWVLFLDKKI